MAGLRPIRRFKSDDPAVVELQTHAVQLQAVPISNGQLVQAVFAAFGAATFITIRHSLARPYLGACLVGVGAAPGTALHAFVPLDPATAVALGVNVVEFVAVASTAATAADLAVTLWVF